MATHSPCFLLPSPHLHSSYPHHLYHRLLNNRSRYSPSGYIITQTTSDNVLCVRVSAREGNYITHITYHAYNRKGPVDCVNMNNSQQSFTLPQAVYRWTMSRYTLHTRQYSRPKSNTGSTVGHLNQLCVTSPSAYTHRPSLNLTRSTVLCAFLNIKILRC